MEQQPLLEHRRDEERAEVELKDSYIEKTRAQARWLLKSKFGHYGVLFLVCCDVAGSFTYILISLYLADHECEKPKKEYQALHDAQDALSIIALVFSCLFMAELTTSIWAFGFR